MKYAIVIFVLGAWLASGWPYNWLKHVATFYDIISCSDELKQLFCDLYKHNGMSKIKIKLVILTKPFQSSLFYCTADTKKQLNALKEVFNSYTTKVISKYPLN